MNGIFKTLSLVVLLVALAGGAVLVQKNAETRKGAAGNEISATILPSKVDIVVGQNFDVHVWVNTGKETDLLTGAEFSVGYNDTNIQFVSAVAQNGYTILNDNLNGTNNYTKVFKVVAMGAEKAGAVDVVKLTFKALSSVNGNIVVLPGIKIMVSGQGAMWDVTNLSGSDLMGDGSPTPTTTSCTPRPPCLDQTPACRVETLPGTIYCKKTAQLGEMCGGIAGIMCATGRCDYGLPAGATKMAVDATGKCVSNTCIPRPPCLDETPACRVEMMPGDVFCSTTCTPRPACLDQTPACRAEAKPGTVFCPVVSVTPCVPRPACADGIDNGSGTKVYCALQTGISYCPKNAKLGETCAGKTGITCESGLICSNDTKIDAQGGVTAKVFTGTCIVPTVAINCGWCGSSCANMSISRACNKMGPPSGKSCVNQNNSCVIVNSPLGQVGQTCGGKGRTQCDSGLICKYETRNGMVSADGRIDGVCSKPAATTVTLSGRFGMPTVVVGQEISAFLSVESGANKVSAINVKALFDPNFFEIISVTPITGSQGITASGDSATGVVSVYMFWQSATSGLPSSPEFATVKLKAKKSGLTTFRYDKSYVHEVSGVDASGNSVGFTVSVLDTLPRTIITEPVAVCGVCTSGLARSTGNANCDNTVNLMDFELWRSEVFDKGADKVGNKSNIWKSDFNCDQMVTISDFEVWRSTVFK